MNARRMIGVRSLVDWWLGAEWPADPLAVEADSGLRGAVVVTGGAEGIGYAIAHRFAGAGHHVVLVSRSERTLADALARLRRAGATHAVTTIALDVTQPDAGERLLRELAEQGVFCQILVNSAGAGLSGPFTEQAPGDLEHLVAVNVTALTLLCREVLPGMIERRNGGIINIGSFGGLTPGPFQAAYYASKAYVISLTEAIARELRWTGVRACVIAPGPVETKFHARMDAESALYRALLPSMSPERVARAAFRGFWNGRTLVTPGLLFSVFAVVLRLLPRKLVVGIVAILLRHRSS